MTLPLRRRHRRMFLAIGLLLPIAFVAGIAARKPLPIAATPNAQRSVDQEPQTLLWERGDLFASHPILVRLTRSSTGPALLTIKAADTTELAKPDLLVYWSAPGTKIANNIPGDALLLGRFVPFISLHIPSPTTPSGGTLVLYSLADHEIVAVSKPLP